MATVGQGVLRREAFGFYDALRSYDIDGALAHAADGVLFRSPFAGEVAGKDALREHLASWLGDAATRPSLTIRDVSGNGPTLHVRLSVSHRFGRAPRDMTLTLVSVGGKVQQAVLADA